VWGIEYFLDRFLGRGFLGERYFSIRHQWRAKASSEFWSRRLWSGRAGEEARESLWRKKKVWGFDSIKGWKVRVRKSEEKRVKEAKRGVAVYGGDKIGEIFFFSDRADIPFLSFCLLPTYCLVFFDAPR
jgi:hypothetical protein